MLDFTYAMCYSKRVIKEYEMSKKLQEAVAVKDVPKKKKTSKWSAVDAFMAVMSLAALNACLVYSVLISMQLDRRAELAIAGVIVLVLNLHIAKRLF